MALLPTRSRLLAALRPRRSALVSAGALALLAMAGAPADAAVVARGVDVIDETFTNTCDGGTPDDPGDDLAIIEHTTGTVAYRFATRQGELVFGTFRGNLAATLTNPDTGRSWSSTDRFLERDVRVLAVDGDVVTMLVRTVFQFTVFDEDGNRDSANRGLREFTLFIDTNGTPGDPSDDESEFGELLRDYGPRGVGDFCVDAERFTVD